MKFGYFTSLDMFTGVARQGWDYLEAHVQQFFVPDQDEQAFEANLRIIRENGIEVPTACCFLPGSIKACGPNRDVEGIVQWGRTVFQRAEKAGTEIIVFGSGKSRARPEGVSMEEGRAQFLEVLRRLAPLAYDHGVTLVIEPLNRNECNLVNSLADGAALVGACDHPGVRLLADFYHMAVDDEPHTEIERFGSIIKHAHLAEKEGRTAPGVHGQDFRPYLRSLRSTGYQGRISLECKWTDLNREAPIALRTLKEQWNSL